MTNGQRSKRSLTVFVAAALLALSAASPALGRSATSHAGSAAAGGHVRAVETRAHSRASLSDRSAQVEGTIGSATFCVRMARSINVELK